MTRKTKIPNFSILVFFVAASIVGIMSLRSLNIQFTPAISVRTIRVSYHLPDVSARVIDSEITSKLEGAISGISGCHGIISTSKQNGGSILINFRKGTNMMAARFDVASRIRNVYDELPVNMPFPDISVDVLGNKPITAFVWEFRSHQSSQEIASYVEDCIIPTLSYISGVDRVDLFGATPFHYVIKYDAAKLRNLGLSKADLSAAISFWGRNEHVGKIETNSREIDVFLSGRKIDTFDFGSIPINKIEDRIIYLRDLATWQYEESQPSAYFRVNGLNTVTMQVTVTGKTNLLHIAEEINSAMDGLVETFPEGFSARKSYDSSEYISAELKKNVIRTIICIVLLLLFVLLSSGNFRYSLMIAFSITVNILLSLLLYNILDIPLHIYTLAGISVSLGLIIDSAIVMFDHYNRKHDKFVFPALVGAMTTTLVSLLMVLLLPESERKNLTDFIIVIIINISVSLLVAWTFIPAFIDSVGELSMDNSHKSVRQIRRKQLLGVWYGKYIVWGVHHKWILIASLTIIFGIPSCLLPSKSELKNSPAIFDRIISKIVSWPKYDQNKSAVDKYIGGTFAIFQRAMKRADFYKEPERMVLCIHAGMLEGATVSQLDNVMKSMENYLSQFEEIDFFITSVKSYDDGLIEVYFKKEAENSGFPVRLKTDVISTAQNFGGANWRISGVDDSYFNNNIVSSSRSAGIILSGYNYERLLEYAEGLRDGIAKNRRVSGAEVINANSRELPTIEYNIDYNEELLSLSSLTPYKYYSSLSSILCRQSLGRIYNNGRLYELELVSSDIADFDLWHVENFPLQIDSTKTILSSVGNISKLRSGLNITRKNQSYELEVAFDFIGSYELKKRYIQSEVLRMNNDVLPVGYSAKDSSSTWYDSHKKNYAWIIILIMAAIYVISAITLESFRLPLAITSLIPVSCIGAFVAFGLSNSVFDQGGFASFVMLCGLTVNAGIYILYEWRGLCNYKRVDLKSQIHSYIIAVSNKFRPIMLTIVSTVLGLAPFLITGPQEVFWYNFAIGTISGMLCSILAVIFILPVFSVRARKKDRL